MCAKSFEQKPDHVLPLLQIVLREPLIRQVCVVSALPQWQVNSRSIEDPLHERRERVGAALPHVQWLHTPNLVHCRPSVSEESVIGVTKPPLGRLVDSHCQCIGRMALTELMLQMLAESIYDVLCALSSQECTCEEIRVKVSKDKKMHGGARTRNTHLIRYEAHRKVACGTLRDFASVLALNCAVGVSTRAFAATTVNITTAAVQRSSCMRVHRMNCQTRLHKSMQNR